MLYQITSEALTASIHALGAEVHSITNKTGLEYIWRADPQVWPRHAPVLFPIVGRLKENRFVWNGKGYDLGQHGFARDLGFEVAGLGKDHILFELKASEATKKHYPFDFIFRIAYRLNNNCLTCTYTVVNPSPRPLLFSVGAHPGFNCPFLPGESFEDYYLEFETEELYCTELDNGLRSRTKQRLQLNNRRLYLKSSLFDKDALVFENGQINQLNLCSSRTAHKITMQCEGWPYFGIWAKKGCRDFLCLEPWYGIADRGDASGELTQKEGMMSLGAGKEFTCNYSVVLA
jgi:galactose mutarotase-like enzyme